MSKIDILFSMANIEPQKIAMPAVSPTAIPPATQPQPIPADEKIYPHKFPRSQADANRIANYQYYNNLFLGKHFEAFSIKINNNDWSSTYAKLRYIQSNFAGLISRVIADVLFSEPINVKCQTNQEFVEAFIYENKMHQLLYESALTNSALGDDVFKLRVAPRNPENPNESSTVILEEINPGIYFPEFSDMATKGVPRLIDLSWKYKENKDEFLRSEIHTIDSIGSFVFSLEGDEIKGMISSKIEPNKIGRMHVVHVPNWKPAHSSFGISDYADIDSLFYAFNNRMTMIDNILDKHSDPILMVPPGVVDEKGRVNKKALGVIEVEDGQQGKPEYIVWDASLENAFKEVEKLVELMFMMSETSPDILGMGQGQSDSGRALKLKILRTLAKAKRKRVYYDHAIKEILYVAQLLAQSEGISIQGKKLAGAPEIPEIEWQDGIPSDPFEAAQIEQIRLDSGTTTKKASIMRLDDMNEDMAEEMVQEIEDETKIAMPTMSIAPNKNDPTSDPSKQNPQ